MKGQPSDLSLLLADSSKLPLALVELHNVTTSPADIALLVRACNIKRLSLIGPYLDSTLLAHLTASHSPRLRVERISLEDAFNLDVVAQLLSKFLNLALRLKSVRLDLPYFDASLDATSLVAVLCVLRRGCVVVAPDFASQARARLHATGATVCDTLLRAP